MRRAGQISVGLGTGALLLGVLALGATAGSYPSEPYFGTNPDQSLGYPILALTTCILGVVAVVQSVRGRRRAWLLAVGALVANAVALGYFVYLLFGPSSPFVGEEGPMSGLYAMELDVVIYLGIPALLPLAIGSALLAFAERGAVKGPTA